MAYTETVKWCNIAPLLVEPSNTEIVVPFRFTDSILMDKLPEWIRSETVQRELSPSKRDLLEDVDYALIIDYDAETLGERDEKWKGRRERSRQSTTAECLFLVNLSLWLAHPSSIRFDYFITGQYMSGNWIWRRITEAFPIYPHKKYINDTIKTEDLEVAKQIYKGISETKRSSPTWVAIFSLSTAVYNRTWEVRYLLLWIALEGLFGSEGATEITYRISQRLALFLETESENQRKLYRTSKECYSWRSKVVHGMKTVKLSVDESDELLFTTEELVRRSLNKILLDDTLRSIFNGTQRESYLEELVFS
jgi:hypothetical protein